MHPQISQKADQSFKNVSSRNGFLESQNGMWKDGFVKIDGSAGS